MIVSKHAILKHYYKRNAKIISKLWHKLARYPHNADNVYQPTVGILNFFMFMKIVHVVGKLY